VIADDTTRATIERLLAIATSDMGQAHRIANFILAWCNTASLRGFDPADMFVVDRDSSRHMPTVVARLAQALAAEYREAHRAEIEKPHQASAVGGSGRVRSKPDAR
jgi:hypothetical protein